MWLKMCPKCGGDLYLRDEIGGKDVVCLQCGQAWPAAQARRDRQQDFQKLPRALPVHRRRGFRTRRVAPLAAQKAGR